MEKKHKECLNLNDFVYLMLAHLASNSPIIDLNNPSNKYICLPATYKQIIENILYAKNGWYNDFSSLINMDEYFEDHFLWEQQMSEELKNVLNNLDKKMEYDFERDNILIIITENELSEIRKKYNNEEINNKMDHFTNLLTSYTYTREYQKNIANNSSATAKKQESKIKLKILEKVKQKILS